LLQRLYTLIKDQEKKIIELSKRKEEEDNEEDEESIIRTRSSSSYNWKSHYGNSSKIKPQTYNDCVVIHSYRNWRRVERDVVKVFKDDVEFDIEPMNRDEDIDSSTVRFEGDKSQVRKVKSAIIAILNQ